jgi:anti-sigma regulatory factor (Ser/Thr protein kinase)
MRQRGTVSTLTAGCDHVVDVYDLDEHLVEDVAGHLAGGLRGGGPAVVIATRDHLAALADRLDRDGIDPVAAAAAGRYFALEAGATLSRCLRGGVADAERFAATIVPFIATGGTGPPPRAFGEMVALLWADGDMAGALALEGLWNDLAARYPFSLWCGYPHDVLGAVDDLEQVAEVCRHHSNVIAPRSYREPGARRRPGAEGRRLSHVFMPTAAAIRPVRRFVTDALVTWGCEGVAEGAVLVASELATNAILHTGGPFRVALELGPDGCRIAVEDTSRETPRRPTPEPSVAGGRGMAVVDALCTAVGTELRPGGKVVWAQVAPTSSVA